jgi:hypothetical protein
MKEFSVQNTEESNEDGCESEIDNVVVEKYSCEKIENESEKDADR